MGEDRKKHFIDGIEYLKKQKLLIFAITVYNIIILKECEKI